MKEIIKKILKEETINTKFLDKVVNNFLNELKVEEIEEELIYFRTYGEMEDMGLLPESEIVINDENEFKKLGWDSYYDEMEDETYYFRVKNPDWDYDYQEFQSEVIYDWLDTLIEKGILNYDENLDDGSYIVPQKIVKIRLGYSNFYCFLYPNILKQKYEIEIIDKQIRKTAIGDYLEKIYSLTDIEEKNYVINMFLEKMPEKLISMGYEILNPKSQNLNENIIDDFIDFTKNELSLNDDFNVNLTNDSNDVETLGNYDIENEEINVITKNRALPDIIRSIAHEMVHHKQNNRGDLKGKPEEGEDGSPWEDEANAKAGELVRIFGKQYPEIYDL